eukprot:2875215-Rhodomonas_salina.1
MCSARRFLPCPFLIHTDAPSAPSFFTFPIVIYPTFEMVEAFLAARGALAPVSYTHLTLPTICSV